MNSTLADNLQFLTHKLPQLQEKLSIVKSQPPLKFQNDELDFYIQNERFYNMDAKLACRLQVQQFMQMPSHFSMHYRNQEGSPRIHQQVINNLNQKASDAGYQTRAKPNYSTLVMLGSGLGHQLSYLSEYIEFRDVIIVEPNDQMLMALLHQINIKQLSKNCEKLGGKLTILQPNSAQVFNQMIMALATEQGFDFLAEITLFRHYNTEVFDQIFEQFKSFRYQWFSAWGFFDDEIQGLQQTLSNVNKHRFVKNLKQPRVQHLPTLIVGNGPSLNHDITFIKQQSENIIIISCGTALASLLRNDIKPDIHVEMERSDFSAMVQQKWFTPELTKDTLLLALNTVSPEVTNKFPRCLLFAKAKDLGSYFLNQSGKEEIPVLYYSNPTATNFAAAATISLGFKNIILAGCDYGFRDPQQHHAKNSDYFAEDSYLSAAVFQPELEVRDNCGKTIYTTRIFNQARLQLEALFAKHPDVNVTNCSDGAYIAHTQSRTFNTLTFDRVAKTEILRELIMQVPTSNICIDFADVNQQLKKCQAIALQIQQMLLSTPRPIGLLNKLRRISKYLESKVKQHQQYVLFTGTFRYLSVSINGHMSRIHSQHKAEYERFAEMQLAKLLEGCLVKLNELEKEIYEI